MNDHKNCTASGAMDFSESLKRQWTRNRLPYAVLLELTPRCNFNCVHCYLQDYHAEEFLSKDDVIQILDLLYDEGILFLTLTGGEVLTRKDFAEIYAYAKRKGFLIEVFTNGYALTEEVIALFQQLPPLLVDISLYGSCEETYQKITGVSGAFAKVTENCRRLKRAGVRTNLKSPILTSDEAEQAAMQKLAAELGLPLAFSYNLSPTIDGNEKTRNYQVSRVLCLACEFADHENKFLETTSETERQAEMVRLNQCDTVYACNVAASNFVVDYRGQMLPCMKLRAHGVPLTRQGFAAAWQAFAAYGQRKASEAYKCRGCSARYYCDVCPAEMELLYGDAECRPEPVCGMARIREQFYNGKISREEALRQAVTL